MGYPFDFPAAEAQAPAAIVAGEVLSYARLREDVAAASRWLQAQGLKAGQTLGVRLGAPYWSWVMRLAAYRLGLCHANLTDRFSEESKAFGGFDVVLGNFTKAQADALPSQVLGLSLSGNKPFAEQQGLQDAPAPAPAARFRQLVFTSGTTGSPKPVEWDSHLLLARVAAAARGQRLDGATRLLPMLGADTTAGLRYPLACWLAGGAVIFSVREGESSAFNVPLGQSNLMLLSPANLQLLLSRSPQPWVGRQARRMIVAGGRLPIKVRDEALRRACAQIRIAYGSSETGSVASGDALLLDRHPGAVGYVLDGAQCEIVDRQGKPCPVGVSGLVRTRTSYMVHGYAAQVTDKAAAAFRGGWFYPGDIGLRFEDGMLAILGRATDTVNLGGVKVSLVETDAAVCSLPEIEGACALLLSVDGQDQLGIAVVCKPELELKQLTQKIKAAIPTLPAFRLIRVPQIPRNAMGKVARQALAKRLSQLLAQTQNAPKAGRAH